MWRIVLGVLLTLPAALGLGCLAVAAAAWSKSHEVAVIRNGFLNDYMSLAAIMGGAGLVMVVAVAIAVFFLLRRKTPTPPDAHF